MREAERKQQRIVKWIRAGDGLDSYHHEDMLHWGVFVVDSTNTSPIATFIEKADADGFAAAACSNTDGTTEFDVSPCLLDIRHRDNFKVPE